MFSIFKKELNGYLNSLIAYIVIVLFLIFTGLILWVFPDSNILDYGYAEMGSFFNLTPYILAILVPAITMRTFSEEYKTGTIEFLMTKPLSRLDIVLGKFLAAWVLIILAILPTLVYYFSISNLGSPLGNIDTGAVMGSYFGLILLAGVFTAIGLAISSFTENQVIAFIIGAFLCYFLYDGIHQLSQLLRGTTQYFVDFISLQFHYASLGRGVIDSRNVIYLCSLGALMIFITAFNLRRK
ncbi:gliding motility-associated ABC transporter permease subunit GldF [Arcticibacterium luteifluviistationis]|uniref:Gliding motility-associated ABC transporter permease subunit GldF n=1 Tax=Arcticibacterium luteifluviistationis TaxID=1784714 RepID=A0A2Z4GC72_9BACT|nr:gliding motility-associated ABC transporter permease subunit GldF [Arcticibacterium luteifluviistationis]AWV98680.1 gliding motility-associated ABC transporter permease subunit GldF [Arcticibacterium luteifluviistationis]